MEFHGFTLLGAKHIDGENLQNGHMFEVKLDYSNTQAEVDISATSCCGHFKLKPDFNLEEAGAFIYMILSGQSRPSRLRKWGKSDFRFFDTENDFRMALSKFHMKDTPGNQLCAGCVGVLYASDDISKFCV